MIVQCPSCTSRYRIRDANIPPSGGKIRCPSCSHSFIVYPEASPEEDKTSITGSNEIAALLGGDGSADDGKTEIVQGDALDKMRALEALKNEMGSALEGDGTVEMQNPLDMWKAAQAATKAAAEEDEAIAEYGDATMDHDDYDIAKTEIVSPDALNIPIPAMSDNSGTAGAKKPSLPKPNIPRPNLPKPGGSVPTPPPPANEVWQDPDATVDAGFHVETASMKAPESVPTPHQEPPAPSRPQASPPPRPQGPPTQPPMPPAQPQNQPAQPQNQDAPPRPVTQEDSGPNAPTTDPFALPESDPFATAGSNPSQQQAQQPAPQQPPAPEDAPEVPVGSQANDPFANANAQSDPGAAPEPAGGPDPRHQGPWKLKTNFGLTYEFPDNKSIRSWMSSREELDGHTLSADGEHFYQINEFPQLHRSPSMVSQQIPSYAAGDSQERPPSGGYAQQPAPVAQQPMSPSDSGLNAPPMGSPGPQVPGPAGPPAAASGPIPQSASPGFTPPDQFGSGQRASVPGSPGLWGSDDPGFGQQPQQQQPVPSSAPVRNEYIPPSQASAWDKILWIVLLVLLLAAGLIAVQTFEIFDVVGEARNILGMPAKVEQPEVVQGNNGVAASETTAVVEQSAEEQAELAEQLMRDARRFKKKNKLADALRKLETIEQIDDSNIEIFEMRAEIFDELGQADEAEAARARISELTPASDDADAGTPDAS